MQSKWLLPLALLAAAIIFAIDFALVPAGYISGAMYVGMAGAFAYASGNRGSSWLVAGVCTVLSALDFFAGREAPVTSPTGGISIVNYAIVLGALWATTGLLVHVQQVRRTVSNREGYLSAIVDAMPAWITLLDKDRCITEANPVGLRMMELESVDQAVGAELLSFVAAEFSDALQWHMDTVFAGRSSEIEFEMIGRRGTRRWVASSAVPLRDAKGHVHALLTITRDITNQRRAEDALRSAERRFRALVENSYDVMCLVDAEGKYLYLSSSVQRMLGMDVQKHLGTSFFDRMHPDDLPQIQAQFTAGLKTPGRTETAVCRIRHEDGSWKWIEAVGTNLLDDPDVRAVVGNFQDISDRRRAEEESRRRLVALGHMDRLNTVGGMVAELAHEISQPLYAICNFAGACAARLADKPGDEQLTQWMNQITQQSQRANEIIGRLRQFVRRESSEARSDVNLHSIALSVVRLLNLDPRLRDVEVSFRFPPRAPLVRADALQLEQVLVNLLLNAAEAMHEVPAAARRIVLESRLENGHVELAVHDSGPGLDDAHWSRLFEPYFTTKPEGMGMGLVISRSIIEDHGGRIWAERNSHRGSSFCFTLPVLPAAGEPNE